MKNVKLRAYAAANLGDDLFLELICARYPHAKFHLCGSRVFATHYSHIPNLCYHSFDTPAVRVAVAGYRTVARLVNRLSGKTLLRQRTTDMALEYFYAHRADVNVFITGSGFMNSVEEFDSLPQKMEEERCYYRLHPYLIGCNFGPFVYGEYLQMYQTLFQDTADLCFRDAYSLSLFPMVDTARMAADIVFSYPTELVESIPPVMEEPYLLVSAANLTKDQDEAARHMDEYVSMIRRLVADRNSRKLHTVFLGFSTHQKDDETIRKILDGVEDLQWNHVYSYPALTSNQALRLIRDAESVVATRYHAMVLALLFGKDVCTICYSEKVRHVLEDIDPDAVYVSLDEMGQMMPEQLESERIFRIGGETRKRLIASSQNQFRELDKILAGASNKR